MIALLETVQPLQFYVSVVISVGWGFTFLHRYAWLNL